MRDQLSALMREAARLDRAEAAKSKAEREADVAELQRYDERRYEMIDIGSGVLRQRWIVAAMKGPVK